MPGFILSVAAASDLEEIVAYLDDNAPHATGTVLQALESSLRRLAEHPGIGHQREDLASEPVRFYAVWSYLVVYRVTSRVEVVRVLHASRDVASALNP